MHVHGVLTVGILEARRHLPFLQWRTGLPMALVAVALALSWPLVADAGLDPGADLFVAEFSGPSPYRAPVAAASPFRIVDGDGAAFARHEADLLIEDQVVTHDAGDERSRAAAAALEAAVAAYVEARLHEEADQAAAFPVRVTLRYEARDLGGSAVAEGPSPNATRTVPSAGPSPSAGAGGPNATDDAPGGRTGAPGDPTPDPDAAVSQGDDGVTAERLPHEIEPPFPIRSLLLTFAYVIPWSFLAQILAGSVLHERLARRGRLLLSSPWSGTTLLAGLTLPYLTVALAVALGVSWWTDAGTLGFFGMLPVLLVLFAAATLIGLLARSQREMTFLLVTVTTALATFLFLPAMFVQVHPVAFLSPVAVVSSAIRGQAVPLVSFLYATVPLGACAGAMAALGVGLFRDEHLFSPAGLGTKTVDALQHLVHTPLRLVAGGVLVVPFTLVLELFVLVLAVMLELQAAFVLFVFGAAIIEESLKGLLVYAHRQRLERPRAPWVVGPAVGLGFFLGEKVALLVALVGFDVLPGGGAALGTFGVGAGLGVFLAPLLLHMTTATLVATQARRGRWAAVGGWWGGVLIHVAYNVGVVFLGVGA